MNTHPYFDKWLDLFYDLFVEIDEANNLEFEEEGIKSPEIQSLIDSFIGQVELVYPPKEELRLDFKSSDNKYSRLLEQLDILFENKANMESWRAFFVSDDFLDAQYETEWGRALSNYLHTSDRLLSLPQNFLIQLYLSYLSREGDDFGITSAPLIRCITYILAVQPPANQKYLYYNLLSDKFAESYVTHNLYRGLLYVFSKEEANDDWRLKGYDFYLKHIHYDIYPFILIKREDEVILLVSYFIRKFKALFHENIVHLIHNFNLINIENTVNKTLNTHLYQAISEAGFDFEKYESDKSMKNSFYNSLLPPAFLQNATEEIVDEVFAHPYFMRNAKTRDFVIDLFYKLRQDELVSYYLWKRLYRFYTDLEIELFVKDEFNWIETGIATMCNLLNSSSYSHYAQLYNRGGEDSSNFIDSYLELTDSVDEEMKEAWLRKYIFFNNLNLDTKTPMRTIYHSILLGLLESLISSEGFTYDMESDGRYIIDYKKDLVIVIFNTVEKDSNGRLQIASSETVTVSRKEYTEIMEDVVNMYLGKYFNITSVKQRFLDLLENAKASI